MRLGAGDTHRKEGNGKEGAVQLAERFGMDVTVMTVWMRLW